MRLKSAVDKADGDVDLLLTCDWPAGVTSGAAPFPDAANRTADDSVVAELAVAIRPRSSSLPRYVSGSSRKNGAYCMRFHGQRVCCTSARLHMTMMAVLRPSSPERHWHSCSPIVQRSRLSHCDICWIRAGVRRLRFHGRRSD